MRVGTGSSRKRSLSRWTSYDVPGHTVRDGCPAATQTALRIAQSRRAGLRVLEEDPIRPRPKADIRPIEGTDPRKYLIQIGDYRAVYTIVGREVEVLEVFTRGRSYR